MAVNTADPFVAAQGNPQSSALTGYIQNMLAQKPEAVDTGSGLSPDQYYSSLDPTAQNKSISDYINSAMTQGGTQLQRQFAPQYEQLQSEQAAMGRAGSPVSLASTGRLRNTQGQAISDMVSGLTSKQAELQSNAAAQRPTQMLAGAQMFGNQNLQAQQLGQQNKQFGVNTISDQIKQLQNNNQFQQQMNFNTGQLAQQGALTREQIASQGNQSLGQQQGQKSGMSNFGNITSGFKNVGQGIGSMM